MMSCWRTCGPPSENPLDDLRYEWDNEALERMFDDEHGRSGGPYAYRVMELPDERMCGPCHYMHQEVPPWVLYEKGLTAPPFHPNCRGRAEVLDRNGQILYVIYPEREAGTLDHDWQEKKSEMLDNLQFILDLAGLIPVVCEPFDIANALISLVCGNYVDAILSAVLVLPLAGWIGSVGKFAGNAEDIAALVAKYGDELLEIAAKYGDEVYEFLTKHGDDAWELITKYGDEIA